jgi:hypothetical protein
MNALRVVLVALTLLALFSAASFDRPTSEAAGIFNVYAACPSGGTILTEVAPGSPAGCVNWFSDIGAGSGNPTTISTDVGTLTESSCFSGCGSPSGNGTGSVTYDPAQDSPFGYSGDLTLSISSCTLANVTLTISQNGNQSQVVLPCNTPSPGVGIFDVYPTCPGVLGEELSSIDPGTHTGCVDWFIVAGAGNGQPFTVSTSLGTLEHFNCFPACNNTGGDGTATLSFDPAVDSPFGYSGEAWVNIPSCTSGTVTFTIVQADATDDFTLPCLVPSPTPTMTATSTGTALATSTPTRTPTPTEVPVEVRPVQNNGALGAAIAAAAAARAQEARETAVAAAQQSTGQSGPIIPPSTGDAGLDRQGRSGLTAGLMIAMSALLTIAAAVASRSLK